MSKMEERYLNLVVAPGHVEAMLRACPSFDHTELYGDTGPFKTMLARMHRRELGNAIEAAEQFAMGCKEQVHLLDGSGPSHFVFSTPYGEFRIRQSGELVAIGIEQWKTSQTPIHCLATLKTLVDPDECKINIIPKDPAASSPLMVEKSLNEALNQLQAA